MRDHQNELVNHESAAPLILLADDEPHITLVLARKLEASGYRVITTEDGEEAFECAKETPPDIVVTDLQMPFMTGIDLARTLKTHEPTSQTPVIMLTARGYVLNPGELESTNIRYVMSKPFSAREIIDKVVELLASNEDSLRKSA